MLYICLEILLQKIEGFETKNGEKKSQQIDY